MPSHDPIKAALADLTFSALRHAVMDLPAIAQDPAHEPLEDCVIEVIPISDLECMVRVVGAGKLTYYGVKVVASR